MLDSARSRGNMQGLLSPPLGDALLTGARVDEAGRQAGKQAGRERESKDDWGDLDPNSQVKHLQKARSRRVGGWVCLKLEFPSLPTLALQLSAPHHVSVGGEEAHTLWPSDGWGGNGKQQKSLGDPESGRKTERGGLDPIHPDLSIYLPIHPDLSMSIFPCPFVGRRGSPSRRPRPMREIGGLSLENGFRSRAALWFDG